METVNFDNGIREYRINGSGVLRFNPCDPNVYDRILGAIDEIRAVEDAIVAEAKGIEQDDGAATLRLSAQADKRVKEILARCFGADNDFDQILGGMNVMAVCGNGERLITNFLNALMPIVMTGVENCAREQAAKAVGEAKRARALRNG